MNAVTFMTAEDGDDLIVSFAIPTKDDIQSLILLRTPKYELLLDPSERGVNVLYGAELEVHPDLLRTFSVEKDVVRVVTDRNEYVLNISAVEQREIEQAKHVLEKMNFDSGFKLLGLV